MSNGEIILYTTEDGKQTIQLRAIKGTVWLTEFVEYFRLFCPQSDIAHYDTEVMTNLEMGGRM